MRKCSLAVTYEDSVPIDSNRGEVVKLLELRRDTRRGKVYRWAIDHWTSESWVLAERGVA